MRCFCAEQHHGTLIFRRTHIRLAEGGKQVAELAGIFNEFVDCPPKVVVDTDRIVVDVTYNIDAPVEVPGAPGTISRRRGQVVHAVHKVVEQILEFEKKMEIGCVDDHCINDAVCSSGGW